MLVIALIASGFALMTSSAGCSFASLQNSCAAEHLSAAPSFVSAVPDAALPERLAFVAVAALAILLSFVPNEPVAVKRADLILRTQRGTSLPRRLTDIFAFSPQLSAVRDF